MVFRTDFCTQDRTVSGPDEDMAVLVTGHLLDFAVRQAGGIVFLIFESREMRTVVKIQSVTGAEPDIIPLILIDRVDGILGEAVRHIQTMDGFVLGCNRKGEHQAKEERDESGQVSVHDREV